MAPVVRMQPSAFLILRFEHTVFPRITVGGNFFLHQKGAIPRLYEGKYSILLVYFQLRLILYHISHYPGDLINAKSVQTINLQLVLSEYNYEVWPFSTSKDSKPWKRRQYKSFFVEVNGRYGQWFSIDLTCAGR